MREFAIVCEVPVAVVVPEDHTSFDSACVVRQLDGKIARFKIPREIITCDVLPRNAMGKVLEYEIREWLNDTSAAEPSE